MSPNRKQQTKMPLASLKFKKMPCPNSSKTLSQTFRQQKLKKNNHADSKNDASLIQVDNKSNSSSYRQQVSKVDGEKVVPSTTHYKKNSITDGSELKLTEPKKLSIDLEVIDPHQCSIEEALQYLNMFDLTLEFGPCTNMTRSQRFKRAFDNDLNPPNNVEVIINRFIKECPFIDSCVWDSYLI